MDSNEKDSGFDGLTAFAAVAVAAVGLWAIFQGDTSSSPKPGNVKNNQRDQELFDEALWLQQNGQLVGALIKAQECLSFNQYHAHAWNLVAWNYLIQNFNLEEGLQIARHAYDIASNVPDKIQFLNTAAETCVALGWLDEAIFEFRRALKLSTVQEFPQPHTLLRLGQCYQIKQDFPAALSCLDQAFSLDPNNPDIPLTLGQINLQKGHYNSALKHYESAIELADKLSIPAEVRSQADSNCLNDIGVIYFHLKDYKKSRSTQEKAHLLFPANPFPLINLVSLSAILNEREQMRYYLERLIPVIATSHQAVFLIQNLLTDGALGDHRDIVLDMLKGQGLISNDIYKQQMLLWNQKKHEVRQMKEGTGSTTNNFYGDVSSFTQGSIVGSIESNIHKLGNDAIAKGFKEFKDQIALSATLVDEQKTEMLQTLNALSKQAILPESQREKGVIKGLLSGFASSVAVGGGLAEMWSTWGPQLHRFFGV